MTNEGDPCRRSRWSAAVVENGPYILSSSIAAEDPLLKATEEEDDDSRGGLLSRNAE